MILYRGVHPPWGNDAFSPCFRFPSVSENIFGLRGKFSQSYVFRKNFSIFIRQNFWRPFLVIDHKFWMSPLFYSLFQHICSPISEIFSFPLLFQISPWFHKIYMSFYIRFVFFVPPTLTMMHLAYASHNARTLLDAPNLMQFNMQIFINSLIRKCIHVPKLHVG